MKYYCAFFSIRLILLLSFRTTIGTPDHDCWNNDNCNVDTEYCQFGICQCLPCFTKQWDGKWVCIKRSETSKTCTTNYECWARHGPSTCDNCQCACNDGYYWKTRTTGFQCVACLDDKDCYGDLVCREDECREEGSPSSWWKMFLIVLVSTIGLSALIGLARYFHQGGSRQSRNVVRNSTTQQPQIHVNNVSTANQPAVIYNIHSSEDRDYHTDRTVVARDSGLSDVSDAPPSYRSMFPQGCPYDHTSASPPPPYPGS